MKTLEGIPVSPGVAIGTAVLVRPVLRQDANRSAADFEANAEVERYRGAVLQAAAELVALRESLTASLGSAEASIFEAQKLMLEDPVLTDAVERRIRDERMPAEDAVEAACEEQAKVLEAIENEYLASRAADLRDIGMRLRRALAGTAGTQAPKALPPNAVILAEDLSPSDTASLDHSKVIAIALERGGRTSHTAILARSLGIPAVVGTGGLTSLVQDGDIIAIDGARGRVVIRPTGDQLLELQDASKRSAEESERLTSLKDLSAMTSDGKRVEVAANVGSVEDASAARQTGAEGIGLFRTEFLFLGRDTAPTEEEQLQAYSAVLAQFNPRPVVIRTLDIGGDKDVPYLKLPREENPFLGLRAIRLCLSRKDLFRTQLRALLRASVCGNLRIMFPMISTVRELREAKDELRRTKAELESQGHKIAERFQVGIMVETPSAAVCADLLAPECDFFSIGTNDLVQYTLACDRGNASVSYLSDPLDPAVLRLIKRTVDEGHKQGIWVGMCGEMAGMPMAIPLLLAMGIDELSMSAMAIPYAKEQVRRSSIAGLACLWERVRGTATSDEVRSILTSNSRTL